MNQISFKLPITVAQVIAFEKEFADVQWLVYL